MYIYICVCVCVCVCVYVFIYLFTLKREDIWRGKKKQWQVLIPTLGSKILEVGIFQMTDSKGMWVKVHLILTFFGDFDKIIK